MAIIKKSGAWFTYEGEQLGQGRENAKNFLSENPEIMVEVSERVRKMAGLDGAAEEEFTEADDQPISIDS
jgi:recombination protein RecA